MMDQGIYQKLSDASAEAVAEFIFTGKPMDQALLSAAAASISLAITNLLIAGFDEGKIKEIIQQTVEVYFAQGQGPAADHGPSVEGT